MPWKSSKIHCSNCLFDETSHLAIQMHGGLISLLAGEVFKQVAHTDHFQKPGAML